MDSIRVLITNICNANCHYCFKPNSNADYISTENFSKLARYFFESKVSRIRLMGGEPSVHPQFGEITGIAQENFSVVTVFKNGQKKICYYQNRGIERFKL